MSRKNKDRNVGLKAIAFAAILLVGFELTLTALESSNKLEEPYDWGGHVDIGFKINQCIHLFEQNPDKVKILVLGDSRVQQSLWPEKFNTYFSNKTVVYNLGLPGTGALFQKCLFMRIGLARFKPDIVIWDLSHNDFENATYQVQENEYLFSLPASRYYFDYTANMTVNEAIDYFLMKTFRIYRYRTNFYYNEVVKSALYYLENGFYKNYGNYSGTHTEPYNITGFSPDSYTLQQVSEMRQYLITNNINHLMVSSPHNFARYNNTVIQEALEQFGSQYLLDLNGNETFSNDSLYSNEGHLNPSGAIIYTNFVIDKLNSSVRAKISLKLKQKGA